MKTIQKGNRQLRVSEEKLEYFKSQGYREIDEKGDFIDKPKDTDAKIISKLKKEIEALQAENEALKGGKS